MVLRENGLYTLNNNMYIPYKIPNGKVIICGVPGAFTPTCTYKHLDGFANNLNKLSSKIIFIGVNDPSVMHEWNRLYGHKDIDAVADPLAVFTKSIGQEVNFGESMGVRSRRYAMMVQDKKLIRYYQNPFIEGVIE